MNHLTLTDEELRLALRFVLSGAKGSYRNVDESEEIMAQRVSRKFLDAAEKMLTAQPTR
jgi:hypothetical protein